MAFYTSRHSLMIQMCSLVYQNIINLDFQVSIFGCFLSEGYVRAQNCCLMKSRRFGKWLYIKSEFWQSSAIVTLVPRALCVD